MENPGDIAEKKYEGPEDKNPLFLYARLILLTNTSFKKQTFHIPAM